MEDLERVRGGAERPAWLGSRHQLGSIVETDFVGIALLRTARLQHLLGHPEQGRIALSRAARILWDSRPAPADSDPLPAHA